MEYSCNFSDDETCYLLASFIDKAPKLKSCYYHVPPPFEQMRQIKAELKVAGTGLDGAPGYIKIKTVAEDSTKQVVLQIGTERTTEVYLFP